MATYMQCVHNYNLEIRIAGYSCHRKNLSGAKSNVGHATWCWQLFLTGFLIKINVKFHKNCDCTGEI